MELVQDGFRALVELSPDAVFVIVDGYHAFANARGIALLGGRTIEDLRTRPAIEFMHESCRDEARGRIRAVNDGEALRYVEEKIVRLDGVVVDIEAAATPIEVDGHPAALVVVRDITWRKQAEAALRAAEVRFQAAFRYAPTGMAIVGPDGRIVDANPAVAALLAAGSEDLVGFDLWQAVDPADRAAVRRSYQDMIAGRTSVVSGVFRYRRHDGTAGWVQGSAAPLENAAGHVVHLIDVTAAKLAEHQLNHRATHDHLTGLPNRAFVLDRLTRLLDPGREPVVVLFIDLDGFKEVNDALGHAAGDDLLCQVAERLRAAVRPTDTVGRLGGDEFLVVLAGGSASARGTDLVRRIRAAIREPFAIGGSVVCVGASIGTAGGASTTADALLAEADAAMYRVKLAGRRTADRYPEAS